MYRLAGLDHHLSSTACCVGWFSLTALVCFLTLMSTLALPAHLLWDRITCSYVLHCWQEYFHFSWIVEEKVEEHDTVIFAEFPHGKPKASQRMAFANERILVYRTNREHPHLVKFSQVMTTATGSRMCVRAARVTLN